MTTGASFGRNVKIQIFATTIGTTALGEPDISYNSSYTEFKSVMSDGSPGFRIKGKVVQVQPTVGFNTNPINISMYNLGPNSRAIIQSKVGTRIAVFAGYGENPKRIALGDILWARTHKEGADYITDIIAGDAHFAMVNGTISRSFSGSVTYQQVVDALIDSLEDQQILKGQVVVPAGSYNQGIVLSGNTTDELSKVCQKIGCSFNIVGGLINILPTNGDNGAPIIDLSESSGLIGIPEVMPLGVIGPQNLTVEVSPSNDISFVSLLRPEIVLSQKVRITSKFINGEYIVGRLVHDFDSWEGPFYTNCQAGKVMNG